PPASARKSPPTRRAARRDHGQAGHADGGSWRVSFGETAEPHRLTSDSGRIHTEAPSADTPQDLAGSRLITWTETRARNELIPVVPRPEAGRGTTGCAVLLRGEQSPAAGQDHGVVHGGFEQDGFAVLPGGDGEGVAGEDRGAEAALQ